MLLSYEAKKNGVVYLLSSHKTTTVDYGEQKKPQAILDCNATKGEVDTADKMLRTYSTKAASQRSSLATFFNLMDITILDTYIICENTTLPGWANKMLPLFNHTQVFKCEFIQNFYSKICDKKH